MVGIISITRQQKRKKMATTKEYVEYVCEQISGIGAIRYKKMFGEYMVYLNEKPIFLVCDNTVYVKKLPKLEKLFIDAQYGYPYTGAKEHYILDIDDNVFSKEIALQIFIALS